jgi:hypothetical protein
MRLAFGQATALYEGICKLEKGGVSDAKLAADLLEMWNLRDRAHRYARDVAPYFHPQLAAVKHDHCTADGKPLRPILVIEGYPADLNAPTEDAPPPKAVVGGGNSRH